MGNALSTATTGLNIYNGLRSGTPTGILGAGASAAKLGSQFGAFGDASKSVGAAGGALGGALGIYNGIKQGGVAGYGSAALNAAQLGSQLGAFSPAIGAAAGAAALGLAPVLYGMSTNPVNLKASWWRDAEKDLAAGKDGPQFWNTAGELLGMISQDPQNAGEAAQVLTKYGLGNWVQDALAPARPGAVAQHISTRQTTRF
jgi:hypothetical protein